MLAAATVTVLAAALVLQPAPASARTTVNSANTVVFTHHRLHPERTVVGSAVAYTRDPAQPLLLSVSVVPTGRTAVVTTVLTNTSGSTLSFGSGLRVNAHVVRNGRTRSTFPIRSVGSTAITSLAPGARRTLTTVFPLAAAGTYTVSAAARH